VTIRRSLGAALLALSLVAAACGDGTEVGAGDPTSTTVTSEPSGSGTLPDRPPELTGTITAVTPFVPVTEDCTPPDDLDPDGVSSSGDPPVCTADDNDVLGTVLVEEEPDAAAGRKISFTVTTATVLGGEGVHGVADLALGAVVDAWTRGPCAESYPEQCGAEALRARS
jgi:hypothetical protein